MKIRELVEKHGRKPEKLIAVLLEYQRSKPTNHLSMDDLKTVAREMAMPESRVYSVATFYSLLSTHERGRHIIQLCNDVPCYINGSFNLRDALEKRLGISVNQTTADGLFTLEYSSCLGCCEKAPVMCVDGDCYGNVTGDSVNEILRQYGG